VLLERDKNVPPLSELLAEVAVIRAIWQRARSRASERTLEQHAASA
jgi:uncharacterized protein (UPF0276 family)